MLRAKLMPRRNVPNDSFQAAMRLAETGRYRNVNEVEVALQAKQPEATIPAGKTFRAMIDVTCLRVRKERGWNA
jgi:hypothetical protein